ncbi:MAG: dTMP kinase [Methanobacteriota archaeon]
MFIALEGIDGCGKTTLAKELAKKGYIVTQEPFLSCTAEVISKTKNPETRELAFYIDRLYHLEQFIIPNLNKTVITDRYKYSQIAYAYARYRGIPQVVRKNSVRKLACLPFFLAKAHGLAYASEIYDRVVELNKKVLEPDIVILLDLPAADALARKPVQAIDFLEIVRKKYLEMADEHLRKQERESCALAPLWFIIDARQEKKEILSEVLKIIK